MAIFNTKVNVKTPHSSGKDLSHSNAYTGKCGTLYPVMVDLLIPGDIVNVKHSLECQLPPMATDFYGRISMHYEAFFVPLRLCYGGWQRFIEQVPGNAQFGGFGTTSGNTIFANRKVVLPKIMLSIGKAGTNMLADYLGNRSNRRSVQNSATGQTAVKPMSVLPFIAYHKIFEDHYRNSNIQAPIFTPVYSNSVNYEAASLPYRQFDAEKMYDDNQYLADGVAVYSLRQRNFAKDYFTNATITPYSASDLSGLGEIDISNKKFSISDLRAANSLQLFAERNNLAGVDYLNVIKANFGVTPTHVNTRSIYLGRQKVPVYVKGISQTATTTINANTSNPFNTIASKFGQASAYDQQMLVNDFRATEHGYLFIIASLVPERLYSSGSRRYLFYDDISDFGFPLLENVGDQPVYKWEVGMNTDAPDEDNDWIEDVFGYTQRYSEYKYYPDEVHGEFKDGETLDSFVLQTSVSGSNSAPFGGISTQFTHIPIDYLKQVKAYQDFTVSDAWAFDFQAYSWFDYKKVSKLSDYSIPSLTNPNLTDNTLIDKSGNFL